MKKAAEFFKRRGFIAIISDLYEDPEKIIDAVKPRRAKFCFEMMGWAIPHSPDVYLKLIKAVGAKNVKLHLDTFHMNIEEKNQHDAIVKAGKHLGHFHACGSDRGTPGNDHLDWPGIAAALRDIRYDGDVVIESFTPDVKVIARAAAIWRRIEPTREQIAVNGLRFLKKNLK